MTHSQSERRCVMNEIRWSVDSLDDYDFWVLHNSIGMILLEQLVSQF